MAFIVGKKQDGKTYYYFSESARVNGKPRIVSQKYLGSADEVMARLEGSSGDPTSSLHRSFGDLCAVWGVLGRLGVINIIDEVLGTQRRDAQVSVGTYIALATLNRVVAPCSKLAFAEWWATTAGDQLVRLSEPARDHRRFWDAMDAISSEQLVEIERRLSSVMVAQFDLDLSGLVLDMTNFATYIDSGNERAPIAQRGHAKQKRNDLRLVGLALVVSTDGAVPLLSHAYPGNRHDATQFAGVLEELVTRWGQLAAASDQLTLVYDAGQDSEANQHAVALSPLHFVGSLPPALHRDLLSVPRRRYRVVDPERFSGLRAFETRVATLGGNYRVVVTHSDTLHAKQRRGFEQTLAKATGQLSELAERLARGRTRKDRLGVEAEITRITKPRWVARVLTWTLSGTGPKDFALSFEVDEEACEQLEEELFGKRILFSDREDWSVADVVGAYRSQHHVESDFRQMKDHQVVSFSPMFHWTDQKIRVHVFYCVLALAVAKLMAREAQHSGLKMSVREMLASLAGIQETVLLYKAERGRPRARRMITEMDPTQQRLYDLFGLETYAPKR
ncbi:MAG: IS1634 family transposase [Acidimicrobiales bacterium]